MSWNPSSPAPGRRSVGTGSVSRLGINQVALLINYNSRTNNGGKMVESSKSTS
uniref:Uncharacterized protein n=1 Tax=Triticum urartu TaxID=4572 RepID=A0A8R7Q215_TRIUA